MVKVSVRKIPYGPRYLPFGQRGNKDSTLQSRGYLKIKDTISDFLR